MPDYDWRCRARELGSVLGARARTPDPRPRAFEDDDVLAELKTSRVLSMLVPTELGGGGSTLRAACDVLRILGRHCAPTALALAMHQHLVAAHVCRHKKERRSESILAMVAEKEAVLASTGASDGLGSSGCAFRVEGGFRVTGRKTLPRRCLRPDVLMTTFAADDEPGGPRVIHCAIPADAPGVSVVDEAESERPKPRTVVLRDVSVPDASITLKRSRHGWHRAWNVTLGVAPPICMAPHVGLAEAAYEAVLAAVETGASGRVPSSTVTQMGASLTRARLVWEDMVQRAGDCDFKPSIENSTAQARRERVVADAVRETIVRATELARRAELDRPLPFERMWRDVRAPRYRLRPRQGQLLFVRPHGLGTAEPWEV